MSEEKIGDSTTVDPDKDRIMRMIAGYSSLIIACNMYDDLREKFKDKQEPNKLRMDLLKKAGFGFPDNPDSMKRIVVRVDTTIRRWPELWIFFNDPLDLENFGCSLPKIPGIAQVSPPQLVAIQFNEALSVKKKPELKDSFQLFGSAFNCEDFVFLPAAILLKKVHEEIGYLHEPIKKILEIEDDLIEIVNKVNKISDPGKGVQTDPQYWVAIQTEPTKPDNMPTFPPLEECVVIINLPFIDQDNDPIDKYTFGKSEKEKEEIVLSPCC